MKILAVIDVQNDFVTGTLANPAAQKALPRIQEKIKEYANKEGCVILYTRDSHEDYEKTREYKYLPISHCELGSWGWQLCPEISPYDAETNSFRFRNYDIIDKSTFMSNDWAPTLCDIGYPNYDLESIELVGFCTDICVISNALELVRILQSYPDCNIIVDASCCASLTPEKHKAALEVMKSCQIEVINE